MNATLQPERQALQTPNHTVLAALRQVLPAHAVLSLSLIHISEPTRH